MLVSDLGFLPEVPSEAAQCAWLQFRPIFPVSHPMRVHWAPVVGFVGLFHPNDFLGLGFVVLLCDFLLRFDLLFFDPMKLLAQQLQVIRKWLGHNQVRRDSRPSLFEGELNQRLGLPMASLLLLLAFELSRGRRRLGVIKAQFLLRNFLDFQVSFGILRPQKTKEEIQSKN